MSGFFLLNFYVIDVLFEKFVATFQFFRSYEYYLKNRNQNNHVELWVR